MCFRALYLWELSCPPLSFLRRIMRDIEESFHDKYRYVTLSFYIYGLAGLMPWNFYITPENYWNDKLCKLEKKLLSFAGKFELEIRYDILKNRVIKFETAEFCRARDFGVRIN